MRVQVYKSRHRVSAFRVYGAEIIVYDGESVAGDDYLSSGGVYVAVSVSSRFNVCDLAILDQ